MYIVVTFAFQIVLAYNLKNKWLGWLNYFNLLSIEIASFIFLADAFRRLVKFEQEAMIIKRRQILLHLFAFGLFTLSTFLYLYSEQRIAIALRKQYADRKAFT